MKINQELLTLIINNILAKKCTKVLSIPKNRSFNKEKVNSKETQDQTLDERK